MSITTAWSGATPCLTSGPTSSAASGFSSCWVMAPISSWRRRPASPSAGSRSFFSISASLYTPITRIVDSNAIIQQAATSLEKIFNLLDTKPHIPENEALPQLPSLEGRVTFDAVSFAYRTGHTTLHDLNFDVTPGETIALVGPSGSGKTTVITLLARFYDPTQGRILVDGKDIRDFNVQSLRRQVGIVMQDNILFSGTIADNIRYGRVEGTHEEMIAAAKAANAHEFIEKLPQGYETLAGRARRAAFRRAAPAHRHRAGDSSRTPRISHPR